MSIDFHLMMTCSHSTNLLSNFVLIWNVGLYAIKWRICNKTLSFPVFRTNWTTREKCFTLIISVITLWLKCLSSPSPRMDWLWHHDHKHHDHHTTIKTIINITIHNAFSVQFCQISPYESTIMDIVCLSAFGHSLDGPNFPGVINMAPKTFYTQIEYNQGTEKTLQWSKPPLPQNWLPAIASSENFFKHNRINF